MLASLAVGGCVLWATAPRFPIFEMSSEESGSGIVGLIGPLTLNGLVWLIVCGVILAVTYFASRLVMGVVLPDKRAAGFDKIAHKRLPKTIQNARQRHITEEFAAEETRGSGSTPGDSSSEAD